VATAQPDFFGDMRLCARYSVRVKGSLLTMSGTSGYTYEMIWGPTLPINLSHQVFGTADYYSSRPKAKLGQATVDIVCAYRPTTWSNYLGSIRRSNGLLLVCSGNSSGKPMTSGICYDRCSRCSNVQLKSMLRTPNTAVYGHPRLLPYGLPV
jgi:hypothetical protein